jgi:putative hydrolase of the HAD superfamily
MMIQAIIFDRDHTLIHPERASSVERQKLVSKIAPDLPLMATQDFWTNWPGPWPKTAEEEPAFWQTYWSTFNSRYNVSQEILDLLHELSIAYHTNFAAYPETERCLNTLRSHGIRLAVLTNFELPSIDRPLIHAGIDPSWFEVLVNSSMLGVVKPDLQAYHLVLDALKLPAEACLFIDDKPVNVQAAQAVGMRGVLIDRDNAHPEFTGERVANLDGLITLVLG